MRLKAVVLIVCGIIEASHRRRHGHGSNRPIYVSEGSSTNRSTRRSIYHSFTSTSSSSEDSTDSSWDGTVSNYSFDTKNYSVYSSQYDSDSLEQSVISTFQQSLQENQAPQFRRAQTSTNVGKRQSEVKERRGKETEIFETMVKRHTGGTGNEMAAKRLSTREQTAQIQGPRRSQVGEARRNSILRRPATQDQPEAQQQPHYLYTSYHEESDGELEREQSIPSDQSYTIEFSSEHHRRFRRHISRSRNNPAAIPAILAQPEVKFSTDPK